MYTRSGCSPTDLTGKKQKQIDHPKVGKERGTVASEPLHRLCAPLMTAFRKLTKQQENQT